MGKHRLPRKLKKRLKKRPFLIQLNDVFLTDEFKEILIKLFKEQRNSPLVLLNKELDKFPIKKGEENKIYTWNIQK